MMTQAHFWTECGSNEVVAGDVVASQNQECDKCCESSGCNVYKCHNEGESQWEWNKGWSEQL